jgi:hypothetical protein
MELLHNLHREEPLIIVATGKYVGEGFDYPRLDTLFLALPISWKGLVAQYAGRLHREYLGKKEVRIYDYIDIHLPMCDAMYRRRLKGYASIGYKILEKVSNTLFGINQESIFSGINFQKPLLSDLSNAHHSIIFSTTKLCLLKHSHIQHMLAQLSAQGVEIVVFSRQSSNADTRLSDIGIKVYVKEKLSLHTVVIDKSIVWYGSIDYLGYTVEEDTAIRITDKYLAEEIINILYE